MPFTSRRPLRSEVLAGLGCLLSLLFCACGGSGGPAPAASFVPGIYTGSSDSGSVFVLAVKQDLSFMALTTTAGTSATPLTLIKGTGRTVGNQFSSVGENSSVWALPGAELPLTATPALSGPFTATKYTCTYTVAGSSTTFPLSLEANSFPAGGALQGTFTGQAALYNDQAATPFIQPTLSVTLAQPLALNASNSFTGTLSLAAADPGQPAADPGQPAATASVTGTLRARSDMAAFDLSLSFGSVDPRLATLVTGMSGLAMVDPENRQILFVAFPISGIPMAGRLVAGN